MAAGDTAFIVDLFTDEREATKSKLISSVNDKLATLPNQNRLTENELFLHKTDTSAAVVVFLSKSIAGQQTVPGSKVFVSNDCFKLLFQAKTYIDEIASSCPKSFQIHLVTTPAMMSFWTAACQLLMAPSIPWSLLLVDVPGRPGLPPFSPNQCLNKVRETLRNIGRPSEIRVLRCSVFPEDQFNAGYHERNGGVSQLPALASMNMIYSLRKNDPLVVIEENKRRLAEAAGFDFNHMHITKAEHGRTIWVVGREEQPQCFDGITTISPGVTICAAGADCCMILLADTLTGAVGAVHSGWQGTALGAVRALLHTMQREFHSAPENIRASIGPAICGRQYDRTAEDLKPITEIDPSLTWPDPKRPGRVHVDLVRANVIMLQREGVPVSSIDTSHALCTLKNKQFFSYRRDGWPFGNQLGFISRRL